MRAALVGLLVLAIALPAHAETLLHLSETASIAAHPDELATSLRAEATSATPQSAQARVNTLIATAVADAKNVAGVAVATGGYRVWHMTQPDRWQASQTLTLTSCDGAALLGLVGTLQGKGLAVEQLAWQLSDALRQKTRDAALAKAIHALRGRVDQAAGLLGLRFVAFKDVRLDQTPSPGPRPVMMFAAKAAPAPTAEATDIAVSATVEADAELQPK